MAETEFKYDVFISYSHKDEEWVRNILLPTLEKQGLKVCIDYRDFIAGKPAIINMQDASEASRHTLLVLTPRWVESEWTLYESILSRTDDPSGLQRRTIPLLLEKCKPPKFISMLSWVDFTDKKRENEAWQNLFKSLDKEIERVEVPKGTSEGWHLAHPYPMPPNFTGRATEQKMLDDWLANDKDRLFILRALGGFGKSALTWQWINAHVNPAEWTKVVWWSFYEGDASFEHFIEETLKYLKLEVPQGQRPQVDELLKAMHKQKILLIMDGFERALRAYSSMNAAYQGDEESKLEDNQLDCVNINAEFFLKGICSLPNIKSKVLMTTRLTPRAVKPRGEFMLGCREEELTAMQKADAVEFFHKQKIKGTHAEIEAACEPYGYHPLSLRILAGLIIDDRKAPGDISAANKLEITKNIVQNKHHVLEVAYNTLSSEQQKLLSTMACFRSPITYEVLETISRKPSGKGKKAKVVPTENLNDGLKTLEKRGLLHWDRKTNKYDLHPIVRQYAYECLTAPQRKGTHVVLVVYFEAIPQPQKVKKLADLAPVVELYHHMVRAGKLDEASDLYYDRMYEPIYYQFGSYQTEIELLSALFLDGEDKPPRLKTVSDQAWALNSLANSYSLSGQPHRAVPIFQNAVLLAEKMGNKENVAIGLQNLALVAQLHIGALSAAERNLRRSIDLCREIENESIEAIAHYCLAEVFLYLGNWKQLKNEAFQAKKLFKNWGAKKDWFSKIEIILSKLAFQEVDFHNAILHAEVALDYSKKSANEDDFYIERDFIVDYWTIGKSLLALDELENADKQLTFALVGHLARCMPFLKQRIF